MSRPRGTRKLSSQDLSLLTQYHNSLEEDISVIEEELLEVYDRLLAVRRSITTVQLAEKFGTSVTTMANALRCCNLKRPHSMVTVKAVRREGIE